MNNIYLLHLYLYLIEKPFRNVNINVGEFPEELVLQQFNGCNICLYYNNIIVKLIFLYLQLNFIGIGT